MKFTALNKVAEESTLAAKAAGRSRDDWRDRGGEDRARQAGHYEGQAHAFNEAHKIMKAEIERLRNLYQNGALTIDEFNTDTYRADEQA